MSKRWIAMLAACALVGCKGKPTPARHAADASVAMLDPEIEPDKPEPDPEPPKKLQEAKSLRLKRSIVVRVDPQSGAKARGTIAQDTRVGMLGWSKGKGCKGFWIEIEEDGWVCDKYLEASKREAAGVELPRLKPEELVPGSYGKLIEPTETFKSAADVTAKKPARTMAGSVKLRKVGEVTVDDKLYWKITTGELLLAKEIAPLTPSGFEGVELGEGKLQLPIAWVVPRKGGRHLGGHAFRDVVHVLEEKLEAPAVTKDVDGGVVTVKPAKTKVRIGPSGGGSHGSAGRGGAAPLKDEWVDGADLRIARVMPAAPGILPGERWIDVDADQQTLVAYEGHTPVFATLVSTGKPAYPTRPGVYRIYVKFAETDMNGQMGDEEPYSVATVPWTQYFAGDLALHTAYWHDKFGEPRSHGCVNLAPKDARRLYRFTDPTLPPGYSMANGITRYPGSIVRIRNAEVPDPEVLGYAKRVLLARSGTMTAAQAAQPDPAVDEGADKVDRTVTPMGGSDAGVDGGQ